MNDEKQCEAQQVFPDQQLQPLLGEAKQGKCTVLFVDAAGHFVMDKRFTGGYFDVKGLFFNLWEQTFVRICTSYPTPYDLKKVDIGGSMVHGNAKVFLLPLLDASLTVDRENLPIE